MPNITTAASISRYCRWRSKNDRSYQDLVSNNNALLAVMRRKGLWQTYSGPRIRQTLQVGRQSRSGTAATISCSTRRSICSTMPFWDPKMVVVPVILSMQEILNNEGENQLMDVYDSYIDAAERALEDAMDAGIYGDGTANGGKQITGLATAVPIVDNTGIYGGIDRTNARSGRPRPTTRTPMATADRHAGQRRPRSARCSTTS